MRWNGENGLDEWAIFTPEWYANAKTMEPDLDRIMDAVFELHWRGCWRVDEKSEFCRRVGIAQRLLEPRS
jgi:hypothetical protein